MLGRRSETEESTPPRLEKMDLIVLVRSIHLIGIIMGIISKMQ